MGSRIALLLLCGVPLALGACDRQSGKTGQAPSAPNAAASATPDEVPAGNALVDSPDGAFTARIDRGKAGTDAPDIAFTGPDGATLTLARFAGKPLLVNLWATWCAPCVAEMPTLRGLAARHAARGLQVIAISQDAGDAASVDGFVKAKGWGEMARYRDPDNQFGFHYGTGLLPTTIVYDARGKEVARVIGAMDWSGEEAAKLVGEAL